MSARTMIVDHTLLELSRTGDHTVLFIQLNPIERRAVKFTLEELESFARDLAHEAMAWRSDLTQITADYYAVLGVSRGATADEIHSAYRARAKRDHPDTSAHDTTAAMQQLNEAYAVLGDPQQRQQYDRSV